MRPVREFTQHTGKSFFDGEEFQYRIQTLRFGNTELTDFAAYQMPCGQQVVCDTDEYEGFTADDIYCAELDPYTAYEHPFRPNGAEISEASIHAAISKAVILVDRWLITHEGAVDVEVYNGIVRVQEYIGDQNKCLYRGPVRAEDGYIESIEKDRRVWIFPDTIVFHTSITVDQIKPVVDTGKNEPAPSLVAKAG